MSEPCREIAIEASSKTENVYDISFLSVSLNSLCESFNINDLPVCPSCFLGQGEAGLTHLVLWQGNKYPREYFRPANFPLMCKGYRSDTVRFNWASLTNSHVLPQRMTYSAIAYAANEQAAQCEETGRTWKTDALVARWPCNPGPRPCLSSGCNGNREEAAALYQNKSVEDGPYRYWKISVNMAFIILKGFRLKLFLKENILFYFCGLMLHIPILMF